MTDAVSIINSVTGSVKAPPVSTNANTQTNPPTSVPAIPASFQNPRVIEDPTAGYITEYLSANGSQVVSQTPSAVTVAYLRNGLQADGTPKVPTEPVHKTA